MKDSILIYDKVKKRDLTYEVYNIKPSDNYYQMTFKDNQFFTYKKDRIIYITEPVAVFDPIDVLVLYRGKERTFDKIYEFNAKGKCIYRCIINKETLLTNEQELVIRKSITTLSEAKRNFNYLYEVSKNIVIKGNNEQPDYELVKQYNKIKFIEPKSALSFYLSPSSSRLFSKEEEFTIYPFGGNKSQDKALYNSLTKNISVIQGPPGTGKTQTILNIISNLIIRNKTVLICSNNNSALDNIIEKLSKENLDYIAAKLGNKENKKDFINNQKNYPTPFPCTFPVSNDTERNIQDEANKISSYYGKISELSTLKQQLQELKIQSKHFDDEIAGNDINNAFNLFKDKTASLNIDKISLYLEVKNPETFYLFILKLYISFKTKIKFKTIKDFSLLDFWLAFKKIAYLQKNKSISDSIKQLEEEIEFAEIKKHQQLLQVFSMDYLKSYLNTQNNHCRTVFKEEDIKKPESFLKEYPIVLSTTFSSLSSVPKAFFDYVIMDEASQVDIATGALALSTAENAVIIGDEKQLPNIVTNELVSLAEEIRKKLKIDDVYSFCEGNSFLTSISSLLPKENITLLKEHYRCEPQIIEFCNKRFYGNELQIMTETKERIPLIAEKEPYANIDNMNSNEKEIRAIKNQIELLDDKSDIGVISPYREQADKLAKELTPLYPGIEVDTVHKFQGREKNTILLSMVKSKYDQFADNCSLINVAVSRAKNKLIVINSGNWKEDSNISALMSYIKYTTGETAKSTVASVFDLLFNDEERNAYFKKHSKVSNHDSENLVLHLLKEILAEYSSYELSFALHYPFNILVQKNNIQISEESERKYALNYFTHIDFLVYSCIDKHPVLAIEVDGATYHKAGSKQAKRDEIKDKILKETGISILRLRTDGCSEREKIKAELDKALNSYMNSDKN